MKRKRVGYAKLGRSMQLDLKSCSSLGGDNEMVPTLKLLAERHLDVDFVLIGRNSGEKPEEVGLPENVTNPWRYWAGQVRVELNRMGLSHPNLSIAEHEHVRDVIDQFTGPAIRDLDSVIMWLGHHGTANTPIPSIKDRTKLTKPYDWATLYASYLIRGINNWRDDHPYANEEILLNADARNYVKYRDLKWPLHHPVIGQRTESNATKHERYGDDADQISELDRVWFNAEAHSGIWTARAQTNYERLEISSLLPGTPFGDTIAFDGDWTGRNSFGVVVNETRRDVAPQRSRRVALATWVVPLNPAFVHGTWSDKTLAEYGWEIEPLPLADYVTTLKSVRSTFTMPASGSGWATAKPWEAFAAGTVCFFHPLYDDQDNILGDAPLELRDFLRVETPADLKSRVRVVDQDPETFHWAVRLQREHFERACAELRYLKTIEARLENTWKS